MSGPDDDREARAQAREERVDAAAARTLHPCAVPGGIVHVLDRVRRGVDDRALDREVAALGVFELRRDDAVRHLREAALLVARGARVVR